MTDGTGRIASAMDSPRRISILMDESIPLVEVSVTSSPGLSSSSSEPDLIPGLNVTKTFRVPFSSIRELLGSDWSTGFMSTTEDGPIYIARREGYLHALVQRAPRSDQLIDWHDQTFHGMNTPRCLFYFKLRATEDANLYRYESSEIYIMDNFLGGATQIHSARRLCNVYDDGAICWGGMRFTEGLTIASLTTLASDFFNMPFNSDLHPSFSLWEKMKKDPLLAYKEPVVLDSLNSFIERF